LELIGIYSHFPIADNTENDYTNKQIKSFQSLLKALEADGIFFNNIHTANSDGINNYSEAYQKPFNRVRLGLNIYGFSNPELLGLKTVVS
jgi:alanine racemase